MTTWASSSSSWTITSTVGVVYSIWTRCAEVARSDLEIRRYPCGHPDPFRSVRDLGRAAARCSRESGDLEGRSPVWLPAAEDTGHRGALVLVTGIGPSTGEGTAPCPAQALPRSRLLPNLTADGFCPGSALPITQ